MNNEIICRADIRREKKKINFIIWYVLVGIVLVVGAIPSSKTSDGKYLSQKKSIISFLLR